MTRSTPFDMIAARIETHKRQIARLHSEIGRLETAFDVMAELAGVEPRQAQKLLGPPAVHKAGFTIRRVVGESSTAPAKTGKGGRPGKLGKHGNVSALIMGALEHGENLKSAAIVERLFGTPDDNQRKRVWQTLHTLKKDGYVQRDDAGQYSRVHGVIPATSNGAQLTVN